MRWRRSKRELRGKDEDWSAAITRGDGCYQWQIFYRGKKFGPRGYTYGDDDCFPGYTPDPDLARKKWLETVILRAKEDCEAYIERAKERKRLWRRNSARFDALVAVWREATGPYSSTKRVREHPTFGEIWGMGKDVLVPLILKDLKRQPCPIWPYVLQELTGAQPIRPEDAGNVEHMAAAWIQWGEQENIQW